MSARKRRDKPKREAGANSDRERPASAESGTPEADEPARFPVVAIGASAGGLSALETFFGAVTAESGMAYVVVQHLAPTQASMLTDLLSRSAPIPVVEAKERVRLRPDNAYVIPPNRYMSVQHGELHLTQMPPAHRLPIDFFMRALAVDQQSYACAVILSGTGSDGTLGVQAIKGEGGVVAVQKPETAEYAGMPSSAIGTGQADFVLAPDAIPTALVAYFRHTLGSLPESVLEPSPAARTSELSAILAALRERKGQDFSLYKSSTIIRRIRRRMAVQGVERYGDYLRLIRDDPAELDRLYQEVLIRVSSFFRDAEAFAALERMVIPKLLERRPPTEPIRIWVPGCATGEEPYSIAMLLQEAMDRLGFSCPVQIFATDIDDRALELARAGRYPASIEADITPGRLKRFFARRGDLYEIDKNIRQMLIFAAQSVASDPPFSRLDLISCRNLLIYMGPELQRRVLPLFHYALKPSGFLFLGTSETVGTADDLFDAVDRKLKIYRRREDSVARAQLFGLPAGTSAIPATFPTAVAPVIREKPDIGELARRAIIREFTPAFVVVDPDNQIVYFHGPTGKFLEPPSGTPSLDVLQMAKEGLRGALRTVLHRARRQGDTVVSAAVQVTTDGTEELLRFIVSALSGAGATEGFMLIQMEELGAVEEQPTGIEVVQFSAEENDRMAQLESELAHTKEALQATIEELETSNEELQSSNEELQSSNEELQSSNEELETSREELQSVNEELHTVNAELESKVEELSRSNDDLNNLLASVDLGIIFLDKELRIQRFTPAANRIIPLIKSDIGRPINHLAHGLRYDSLDEDVQDVMATLQHKERRVQDRGGHWYLLRIRPYRTASDRVSGAVLAFVDIAGEEAM